MATSNRTNVLLNKIFKHQGWLKHAVSLGANPVFLGYDLISFFNGTDSPMYLALMSMDFTGDLHYSELLESLKEPKRLNEELAEYSLPESNITLNIWEALKRDDHTQITSFERLFRHDSTTLRTAILYYNGGAGKFQKLVIKDHPLPWKKQYRVSLPLCRSVYDPTRSLEWVVALYVKEWFCKDSGLVHSRLLLGSEGIFSPGGPLDPDTAKLVQPLLQGLRPLCNTSASSSG
ncbi:hypothetical protein B0T10DRAFT_579952 [Thelonectria olida]|uniref:Uncharacterized protein n=1 Tax=Thelonectria olida TaxID=1576542 RepID=A0A9P8W0H5_9HYPO|nr:hypothetical protein B0T10DRAFT_579952 [Thelonectria olida]